MAESHQDGGGGADFDLTQFYQIFFEEAGENLDQMEQILLDLSLDNADDEELNGIFRCAHSIKGGAATFGFADVAELTHHMESLLDKLRRHELALIPQMVDVLLESADASRILLARHQSGAKDEPPSSAELVHRIAELASGVVPATTTQASGEAVVNTGIAGVPTQGSQAPETLSPPASAGSRQLLVRIGPLDLPSSADVIKELFRDIPGLGTIADGAEDDASMRSFIVETSSSDEDLLDLFAFHVAKELVAIVPLAPRGAHIAPHADDVLYGFFADAPGSPEQQPATIIPKVARDDGTSTIGKAPAAKAADSKGANQTQAESTTIRVAVNKVDQLINLVGELVITQAMLAQNSRDLDTALYQQLLAGLADLDRNTRDLQESVMSIRMIPMSIVFSRFPRMLRDLANKLGKKVDLVTLGEATELDKGLVEKITDPLTHLVRNSGDHGIEMPAERLAKGKPEHGTITLSASHQGGSIVIEVKDDGRGLSREKILRKAHERGIDVSEQATDAEVWQLIFAPGFSTADVVTDVSGRGVGLDVVKKNIAALNGSVEVDSSEGYGMRVAVRLPLTLAIMDGMSVGVGDEVYILPLSSVVESFQVNTEEVSTIGQGSRLVKVREEYMPVIAMEKIFEVPRNGSGRSSNIMVVVESDGSRVALLVDELLGQHQVVVKNLESNYRKIPNVSGATILGDGKVALILDTGSMVRLGRAIELTWQAGWVEKEEKMNVNEKNGATGSPGAREYLTFRLDKEEYGIDILKVQEIRGYEPPTRIAHSPEFIKGVVNLRGTIVPIVDMRIRFNCEFAKYDNFTVVIILNLHSRVVGIVVDSVSDVMEISAENIQSAPDIESAIDSGCIFGLGSVNERMLILLDIEKLMSNVDMGLVAVGD